MLGIGIVANPARKPVRNDGNCAEGSTEIMSQNLQHQRAMFRFPAKIFSVPLCLGGYFDSGAAVLRLSSLAAVLLACCAFHLQAQVQPDLRTGTYRGREITYQVVDGYAIYQGDIILGRADELDAASPKEPSLPGLHPLSAFNSTPTRFWPNGVVPYEIDPAIPNQQRIANAVDYYAQNTPVRFIPHTTEANFVKFIRTSRGDGVCSSLVGMTGGQQPIMTEDGCSTGGLVHEMGHAIGFYHEQERKDRNQYVTVVYEDIDKTKLGNYTIGGSTEQDLGFYDFASHMHYSPFSFSRSGEVTIQTVPAGIPLTEPPFFSAGDLDTIQRLYGTPPTSFTVTSNPEGLQIKVDDAAITTPSTFTWSPGSTHTLEAPGPQTTSTARYQFGIWSDGGAQAHTITASASATVYSASFIRQLRNTITVQPAAGGTVIMDPSSPDGYYDAYTAIQLRALPAPGYSFQRWFSVSSSLGCPGLASTNPAVIRPGTTAVGCLALFTQSPLTTILSDPPGRTLIVDNTNITAPLNIAISNPTNGNMIWTAGSTHSVSARTTAASSTTVRYIFKGWSDGGADSHNVTAAPGTAITALFTTQYQFAVVSPPASQGTITLDPPTPDGYYDNGAQVQVTATPAPGFVFVGWGGDLGGAQPTQTLTVNEQRTVSATFARTAPPLVVVSAATFRSGPVSPGEIVTIFGSDIGPPSLVLGTLDASGRVATDLSGTQVLFGGVPAPILYASAGQTSAVVPYAVAGRTSTTLQIVNQGRRSASLNLPVTGSQPGLFTQDSSGKGVAAVVNVNPDGSGTINSLSNPAPRGSVVLLYVTGEGQTAPGGTDGLLATLPPPSPTLPVSVRIGGKPAQVLYAGGAPNLVAGLMQINAQIPSDLLPGPQSLYVVVGPEMSPQGVTIAVK